MNHNILKYSSRIFIFLIFIPLLMFYVSGQPDLTDLSLLNLSMLVIVSITALSLSIWSIIYIKHIDDGNPFDTFNPEVTPITQFLKTTGPYGLCRNPILVSVFIFHAALQLAFLSHLSFLIFLIEIIIINIQVEHEERILIYNFGAKYEKYIKNTYRFLPLPKTLIMSLFKRL